MCGVLSLEPILNLKKIWRKVESYKWQPVGAVRFLDPNFFIDNSDADFHPD